MTRERTPTNGLAGAAAEPQVMRREVLGLLRMFACKAVAGEVAGPALRDEAVGLLARIEGKSREDIRKDIEWRLAENRRHEMRTQAEEAAAKHGPEAGARRGRK